MDSMWITLKKKDNLGQLLLEPIADDVNPRDDSRGLEIGADRGELVGAY